MWGANSPSDHGANILCLWHPTAQGRSGHPAMDGHHASPAGEYLGGLVFYEFLYGTSAVGNRFRPEGMDAEHARFLQEMAHKAVESAK